MILMSNLLTTEEAAFVTMAQYVVYAWTGISLLMALKMRSICIPWDGPS